MSGPREAAESNHSVTRKEKSLGEPCNGIVVGFLGFVVLIEENEGDTTKN
jgi:hypothetical protein